MTQQITLNGEVFSDDGSVGRGMADGGFRDNLIPMLGAAIVDMSGKVEAAAAEVDEATNQAAIATAQAGIAIGAAASTVTGPGSTGTSTSTLTVGMGSKALNIQTGKTLYPGVPIAIAASATPRDAMYGTLVSYNAATGAMVVAVTNLRTALPGVYITDSSWIISVTGPAGVTGVLNEFLSTPIASAATINLDAATGNYLHITGSTGPVTTVTLAQGAERVVTLDSTPTFVNSANLILPTGASVIGEVGDVVTFRGEGGGVTKVANWVRASGKALAVVPVVPAGHVLLADLQPSASVSIDLLSVFDSTYDNYLIVGSGMACGSSANSGLVFRLANSGVVDAGVNYWNVSVSGGVTAQATPGSSGFVGPVYATNASTLVHFELRLKNVNDTVGVKASMSELLAANPAAKDTTCYQAGNVYKGGKASGIRLFWNDGSSFAASGHIRVYGMRNS